VQEGNLVPEEKQLDIKGIECMTKSSKSEYTRNALKKILLEDVMKAPVIDQLKFVKDIAILEKSIVNSVQNGEKKFFGGVGYSPNTSVTLLLGGMFHGVNLGYSYQLYTSGVGAVHGSHELVVGYLTDLDLFKKGRNKHQSVRWL
jgi:hypothetical protein